MKAAVPSRPVTEFKFVRVAVRPERLVAVVAVPAVVAEVAVAALPPIERFATGVVEATTNGAVPVVAVELIWPEMVSPVKVPRLVMLVCAAPVTEAALPVTLPEIGAVTVSPESVPTEVKEEASTFEARVAPESVPAGAADKVASDPWEEIFPAVREEAVPVRPAPLPANPVAVKIPVFGTKESLVEVVFCGRFPVFAVTQVR